MYGIVFFLLERWNVMRMCGFRSNNCTLRSRTQWDQLNMDEARSMERNKELLRQISWVHKEGNEREKKISELKQIRNDYEKYINQTHPQWSRYMKGGPAISSTLDANGLNDMDGKPNAFSPVHTNPIGEVQKRNRVRFAETSVTDENKFCETFEEPDFQETFARWSERMKQSKPFTTYLKQPELFLEQKDTLTQEIHTDFARKQKRYYEENNRGSHSKRDGLFRGQSLDRSTAACQTEFQDFGREAAFTGNFNPVEKNETLKCDECVKRGNIRTASTACQTDASIREPLTSGPAMTVNQPEASLYPDFMQRKIESWKQDDAILKDFSTNQQKRHLRDNEYRTSAEATVRPLLSLQRSGDSLYENFRSTKTRSGRSRAGDFLPVAREFTPDVKIVPQLLGMNSSGELMLLPMSSTPYHCNTTANLTCSCSESQPQGKTNRQKKKSTTKSRKSVTTVHPTDDSSEETCDNEDHKRSTRCSDTLQQSVFAPKLASTYDDRHWLKSLKEDESNVASDSHVVIQHNLSSPTHQRKTKDAVKFEENFERVDVRKDFMETTPLKLSKFVSKDDSPVSSSSYQDNFKPIKLPGVKFKPIKSTEVEFEVNKPMKLPGDRTITTKPNGKTLDHFESRNHYESDSSNIAPETIDRPIELPGSPVDSIKPQDSPVEPIKPPDLPVEPIKFPDSPVEPIKFPDSPVEPIKLPHSPVVPIKPRDCPVEPIKPPDCPVEPIKLPNDSEEYDASVIMYLLERLTERVENCDNEETLILNLRTDHNAVNTIIGTSEIEGDTSRYSISDVFMTLRFYLTMYMKERRTVPFIEGDVDTEINFEGDLRDCVQPRYRDLWDAIFTFCVITMDSFDFESVFVGEVFAHALLPHDSSAAEYLKKVIAQVLSSCLADAQSFGENVSEMKSAERTSGKESDVSSVFSIQDGIHQDADDYSDEDSSTMSFDSEGMPTTKQPDKPLTKTLPKSPGSYTKPANLANVAEILDESSPAYQKLREESLMSPLDDDSDEDDINGLLGDSLNASKISVVSPNASTLLSNSVAKDVLVEESEAEQMPNSPAPRETSQVKLRKPGFWNDTESESDGEAKIVQSQLNLPDDENDDDFDFDFFK